MEKRQINLTHETISKEDIKELCDWLQSEKTPRLTKGELTLKFEQKFSEYIGCKHSLYVNSGSSANLLMLSALKQHVLKNHDDVVVPIISWSTDVAPLFQLSLSPIFIDYDENLQPNIESLEKAILRFNPKAFLCVSALGLVPKMQAIKDICDKYGVVLIEDNCESLGAKYGNKLLGNFGLMSSFSFYFSHHISTIEGGMVCTNNSEVYNTLLMLRNHGWIRDLPDFEARKKSIGFKADYTFEVSGFNLRNTEIGAFLGLRQLDKLDSQIKQRNENFYRFNEKCASNTWKYKNDDSDAVPSSFALPYICDKKETNQDISKYLTSMSIENRPLVCGDIRRQKFVQPKDTIDQLYYKNRYRLAVDEVKADVLENRAMYLPNHENITSEDVDYICDMLK